MLYYENIMHELNLGHCGIQVKVTLSLAMFNDLLFQITRRWLLEPGPMFDFPERGQSKQAVKRGLQLM